MADIFGRNMVREALKSGAVINKIWLAKGNQTGSVQEIIGMAKDARIQIQMVERAKLDHQFPGENHQGIAASIASADYVDWQEIVAAAKAKGETPLLVILDELEDPHNLGAILRTVDALGAHGVIIPSRRSVSLTEGVAKASAGAVLHVPVARVGNLNQVINALKKEGIWIAGTSMDGQPLYEANLTLPLAIVIGSEGKGLGRLIEKNCDFIISIPMCGHLNSLNASVAASLCLYEAVRQRQKGR